MSRGMLIVLVVLTLVVGLAYWGIPALKRRFLGESLQVRYSVTMAEDAFNAVDHGGQTVSRTVLGLEVEFPIGSAPDNVSDLQVMGDDGQLLPVNWTKPETQDFEDRRVTRWIIKPAFFPLGFRQGMLRTKHRELCYIRVPKVPYP